MAECPQQNKSEDTLCISSKTLFGASADQKGDTISFEIIRDGKQLTVDIVITADSLTAY